MNEVAKILGVKIGECFDIDTKEGKFVFDNNGLYSMNYQDYCPAILCQMLAGRLKIKCIPWSPQFGETYYLIIPSGNVESSTWLNAVADISLYKLGNCYPTKGVAEQHRDKWIAFYASDEVLEV